jgi:hypothetical protein
MAFTSFEITLNGCALFNHGTISLPPNWKRRVRFCLVTPDMHRIHHSALQQETEAIRHFHCPAGIVSSKPTVLKPGSHRKTC